MIDVDGNVVEADLEPSSEVPMHTSVYQATDAGAVVHTHPMYCTALSVTMDEVPPVHYMIALLGGPVRTSVPIYNGRIDKTLFVRSVAEAGHRLPAEAEELLQAATT